MKDKFLSYFKNIISYPGFKTKRKLVLFLVDDYGSIRMSSKTAFNNLTKKGLKLDKCRYSLFDSLESNDDLEELFNLLIKYKDSAGNHPIFTPMVLVANPDFEKIRNYDYQQYFYEPLSATIKRYNNHDRVIELWIKGIEQNIFVPQFHGREHLNVKRWMDDLRNGVRSTHLGFDYMVTGLKPEYASDIVYNYQAAFDFSYLMEIDEMTPIIFDGVNLFKKVCGYSPIFFTPTNAFFSRKLDGVLKESGIKVINSGKIEKEPVGNKKFKYSYHYTGQKNKNGQYFLVRNALFEPGDKSSSDWVNKCMREISNAFSIGKPAIVSSHRVNFSGYHYRNNRSNGLKQLDNLFKAIINKWPDVEFINMNTLYTEIHNYYHN